MSVAVCVVELFGLPRLLVNREKVEVEVEDGAPVRDLLRALARHYPTLVGPVVLRDLSGLQESYLCNRNGLEFVSDLDAPLGPGDTLLLLPAASGG